MGITPGLCLVRGMPQSKELDAESRCLVRACNPLLLRGEIGGGEGEGEGAAHFAGGRAQYGGFIRTVARRAKLEVKVVNLRGRCGYGHWVSMVLATRSTGAVLFLPVVRRARSPQERLAQESAGRQR